MARAGQSWDCDAGSLVRGATHSLCYPDAWSQHVREVASKASEKVNNLMKAQDLNPSFQLLNKGFTSRNSGLSHQI